MQIKTIEEIYNKLYPRKNNADIYSYEDLLGSLLCYEHLPSNLEYDTIADADNEFYIVNLYYIHPKMPDNQIQINHFDYKPIDSIEDVYKLIETITNQINYIDNLIK